MRTRWVVLFFAAVLACAEERGPILHTRRSPVETVVPERPVAPGWDDHVVAPHALTPIERVPSRPRVRARARYGVRDLTADGEYVYWFELASREEGRAPAPLVRSSWIRMPIEAGSPAIVQGDIHVSDLSCAIDAEHVYWPSEHGVSAMPLGGGPIRALTRGGPAWRITTGAGAVFYTIATREDRSLYRVPSTGGDGEPIAEVDDSAATVLGDHVYWVADGSRCIVRAPTAGGESTPVFCDHLLMRTLATDGERLYGLLSELRVEGIRTTLFALSPEQGGLTELRAFDGMDGPLSAYAGRVAVAIKDDIGPESEIFAVGLDGTTSRLAARQPRVGHLVLTRDRAFWTVTRDEDDLLADDIVSSPSE